jgi:uncharacterized membrane protein
MWLEHLFKIEPGSSASSRSWKRSLIKTITWRLFATADTFIISLLITGSFAWAGSIVSFEVFTKMALYFVHERAWSCTRWGVVQPT